MHFSLLNNLHKLIWKIVNYKQTWPVTRTQDLLSCQHPKQNICWSLWCFHNIDLIIWAPDMSTYDSTNQKSLGWDYLSDWPMTDEECTSVVPELRRCRSSGLFHGRGASGSCPVSSSRPPPPARGLPSDRLWTSGGPSSGDALDSGVVPSFQKKPVTMMKDLMLG